MVSYSSVEKLVIDEGIPADVPFDEVGDDKGEDLFEEEGDKEGKVDVFGGDVENVDKVDEIEEEEELVAGNHDVAELIPHVFEEDREFAYHLGVYRTADQLLEEAAFPQVEGGRFDALEVKFEGLEHGACDLFQIKVVLVGQHVRDRV